MPLSSPKPIVIAGPCMAESFAVMDPIAHRLSELSAELGFDFFFKASFDKANRSAIDSYRGPGLAQAGAWFTEIKARYGCKILTDVHEVAHVDAAAEVCDALQIPAFLCRQTDLLVAAVATGRYVNIKKGQFMAPGAMAHIVAKVRASCEKTGGEVKAFLTERGASFGYGDLVVDMRSLPQMAQAGLPLIFDITHSTQAPPAGREQTTSGAQRCFAPVLARAALATGYLAGVFMEVHPKPEDAKSDAAAQLNLQQAEALLRQLMSLWPAAQHWADNDKLFR